MTWFSGPWSPAPAVTTSPVTPPPPKVKVEVKLPKWEEYIDVDLVNAIIEDGHTQELNWLRELLIDGMTVRNLKTNRPLKVDRFLKAIDNRKVDE